MTAKMRNSFRVKLSGQTTTTGRQREGSTPRESVICEARLKSPKPLNYGHEKKRLVIRAGDLEERGGGMVHWFGRGGEWQKK